MKNRIIKKKDKQELHFGIYREQFLKLRYYLMEIGYDLEQRKLVAQQFKQFFKYPNKNIYFKATRLEQYLNEAFPL